MADIIPIRPMAPEPKVLLAEAEDGPGFSVSVLPPPSGPGHDRHFDDYLRARAYARLLRFGSAWPLVDRVDVTTRRSAELEDQEHRERG